MNHETIGQKIVSPWYAQIEHLFFPGGLNAIHHVPQRTFGERGQFTTGSDARQRFGQPQWNRLGGLGGRYTGGAQGHAHRRHRCTHLDPSFPRERVEVASRPLGTQGRQYLVFKPLLFDRLRPEADLFGKPPNVLPVGYLHSVGDRAQMGLLFPHQGNDAEAQQQVMDIFDQTARH
ncbi:MAG: hypothetical protein MZW92_39020 [Comamonadaceae bacterium]|nr:hypothetical protein [Comamonadaceae bacterium]